MGFLLQEDGSSYILQEDGASKIQLDGATVYTQALTAGLSFSGNLSRKTSHNMTATLSFVGALKKLTKHAFTGGLSFVAALKKTVVIPLTAKLSFATGNYKATILADSPSLYWRLDENGAASSVYADSSGNSHPGAQWLAPASSVAGIVASDSDTAIHLDGSANCVIYSPTYNPWIAGAVRTYEVWAELDHTNTSPFPMLISSGGGASVNSPYLFWGIAGTGFTALSVQFSPAGNQAGRTVQTWSNAIPAGPNGNGTDIGVHMVLVHDDGAKTAELFINGASQGKKTGINALVTSDFFRLGHWYEASTIYGNWFGTVDEGAVYEYALTPTQILAHYNAGVSNGILRQTRVPLAAALSFAAALSKFTSRKLTAALSFVGVFKRLTKRHHTASLSFSGSLSRKDMRTFTGALSFATALTKQPRRKLTGALSFATALTKKTERSLAATIQTVANLSKKDTRNLSGNLSFVGRIDRLLGKNFTATLGFIGSIYAYIRRPRQTTVSSSSQGETISSANTTTTVVASDTIGDVQGSAKNTGVDSTDTNSDVSGTDTDTTITSSRTDVKP